MSVSYTHLDVYKRQGVDLVKEQIRIASGLPLSYRPVSYTHLDVYKRQGQGSSFSFETEKVVYKEDGNIDYSATEKVRYEIISVVNSNPDAVSVTYSEGGSSVAYQCKEIGDADLTVTYKLPDDETETTYTWLCHMHVTDCLLYTSSLAIYHGNCRNRSGACL